MPLTFIPANNFLFKPFLPLLDSSIASHFSSLLVYPHHRRRDTMAAFKNNRALLLLISLSSIFLSLAFAQAPNGAKVGVEVEGPSPGTSESKMASPPAPVSYISSSPDASPASAPSPLPSTTTSSSSSSSGDVGEIYGLLETSVTTPVVEAPALGKDVQAQVSKVVQSSVIAVKSQTEVFLKNVIAKRLSDPETQAETRTCLKQCKENYDDANDDISKVMDDLSTGDYYKAMVDVEGISTFVDTCYDCLREMVGDEPEFKKFDDWVKGVTGDCLEQLDKINS